MARGSIWQGIRNWLKPVLSDASTDARADVLELPSAPAPMRTSGAGSEPEPDGWPANVVPLVRGAARTRSLMDATAEPMHDAYSSSGDAVLDASWEDAQGDPELLEFLASDLDPIPANPEFRERLREELWEMVVDDQRAKGGTKSLKPRDLDR